MDSLEQFYEDGDVDNELCGICDDVVIDRGVLDNCDHWFCFTCIDNWATITNLCPLCKKEFQLITCLPVYDTTGNIASEDCSFSRDGDWCIQGQNNTLSFPSYYIDEDAVKCLDDDGCKIKNALSITDEDLTLDTSIACDSCDIWYHAFCVGFDPERGSSENSWLCPRCVTDETAHKSDCVLSKNINDNSTLKDGIGWISDPNFSSKVSVSVDDDGETAVVVSIIEAPCETNSSASEIDINLKTSTNVTKYDEQLEDSAVCRSDPCASSNASVLQTDDGVTNVVVPLIECDNMEHFNTDRKAETSLSDTSACEAKFELPVDNECSQPVGDYPNDMISKPIDLDEDIHDTSGANDQNSSSKHDGKTNLDIVERHLQHTGSSDVLRVSLEDCQVNATDPSCSNINKRKIEMNTETQVKKAKVDGKSLVAHSKWISKSNLHKNDMFLNASPTKSNPPNIMSIVREDNSTTKSLRLKKIMRRDRANEDSFQKLREEIKEVARDKTSTTKNIFNDFEGKLLSAFRAAVVKPKEESNGRNVPSSLNVKKNLLQKGKAREKLTKKIYGTSNGKRRRAWDREWEVEFWKYRCNKKSKPEKNETLSSVLDILKKAINGYLNDSKTEEQDEENSILSRVYIADTSLFPRKDDIKPLSAMGESSETTSSCSIEKKPILKKSSTISLTSEQTGSRKNVQSSDKEMNSQTDLSKIDKKKWAMEILARKNASSNMSSSAGEEEDKSALKGKYPLLAQLPMEMRPVPEPSRHNKVPLSVRQAQLYRITEHFLKATNQTVIRKTADTELAIADAVNTERGIFEKSSSKVVYVNLCAQALSQKSVKPSSSEPVTSSHSTPIVKVNNQAVEEALKLAGLSSDSPPNSPCIPMKLYHDAENSSNEYQNPTDIDSCKGLSSSVEEALKLAGLSSDSPPNSPCAPMEQYPNAENTSNEFENPHDEDSCKDLSISMEENYDELTEMPKEHIEVSEPGAALSTPKCDNANTIVTCKDEVHSEGKMEDSKEIRLKKICIPATKICEEASLKESENNNGQSLAADEIKEESVSACQGDNLQSKNGAKIGGNNIDCKADSGTRGEKVLPAHSLASENVVEEKAELTSENTSDQHKTVARKVEAYVKEHIRPLCKSGVITVEEYRWAVGKTTDKVMKYHHKAKDAKFLIKEGEKVKKLAEQYAEAAQKRKES